VESHAALCAQERAELWSLVQQSEEGPDSLERFVDAPEPPASPRAPGGLGGSAAARQPAEGRPVPAGAAADGGRATGRGGRAGPAEPAAVDLAGLADAGGTGGLASDDDDAGDAGAGGRRAASPDSSSGSEAPRGAAGGSRGRAAGRDGDATAGAGAGGGQRDRSADATAGPRAGAQDGYDMHKRCAACAPVCRGQQPPGRGCESCAVSRLRSGLRGGTTFVQRSVRAHQSG